jgi:16S rRNA (cytidine1402-2'-O)-methyltransferase
MGGLLSVVPTPIGNLGDITQRALEALKNADLIACEDTRHSKVLFEKYGIHKPVVSVFDQSERRRAPALIDRVEAGERVALISDAGTPGIADPGFRILAEAIRRGVPLEVLPGPTAFVTALLLSGFPVNRFAFEGFVPVKDGARRRAFESLKNETRTLIFYESPHRILKTLAAWQDVFGDRPLCVARELTKKFEEVLRGPVSDVRARLSGRKVLGEFVLVFNPSAGTAAAEDVTEPES